MSKLYQYHTLGNSFILFDWSEKQINKINAALNHPEYKKIIHQICNDFNVDGVVIIQSIAQSVKILMFNADGSAGSMCLNGLRSVAHYLLEHYDFPHQFILSMFEYHVPFEIDKENMILRVSFSRYEKPLSITVNDQKISGHCVNLGNPHFVILKQVSLSWLKQYGSLIEKHEAFPGRTNIEYVWINADESRKRNMPVCSALFFERGCGHTLSCGSGAAAIMRFLYHEQHVGLNQKVLINTEGGEILSYVDNDDVIVQTVNMKQIIGINIHDSHLSCFTDKWKRILQLEDD
ncbi:MAG: diaminopimelate epimerase [Gammaproteobacteria bacterium RIFCSPHIGHO2_02_FULL_42_13]|nr:MAG: diaminopimelate epimerase [Gammaproteobacteria bacterium RIFCSPHIGHO2_02_FULL_42_13]OGT70100.1 MAG: diaminopimelate epimerase [Gammaproteobacteria bacterium RIFCSPLOWO2_02_FULL_42_9]